MDVSVAEDEFLGFMPQGLNRFFNLLDKYKNLVPLAGQERC